MRREARLHAEQRAGGWHVPLKGGLRVVPPPQLATSPPARLGCNLAGSFPLLPSTAFLLQTEGKRSSHCRDTEDAPGMPMTNLPPCQGDFLQHGAGPQHATSSHPGLPGHTDDEEEEEGKHCRHGSSCGGEGAKGLAMHSLGVSQVG